MSLRGFRLAPAMKGMLRAKNGKQVASMVDIYDKFADM